MNSSLGLYRTIVTRRIVDFLRGIYRRREELVETIPEEAIEVVSVRIDAELAHRLLDELEKEDRHLIEMQILRGMTFKELSEQLGLARGTVLSRIHRIKQRLRQRATQFREDSE